MHPFPPGTPPAALGYRMPAEWEPHVATWLSWPRPDGISFPGRYETVPPVLAKLVATLSQHEIVNINVGNTYFEQQVRAWLSQYGSRDLSQVRFHHVPTNEPWCRDHGPIFLTKPGTEYPLVALDWGYNAWGNKYPPFDLDDAVPARVAEIVGDVPVFTPGIVLEGGSIEVNGAGSLLTTESCLLNPNRNPSLGKADLERYLRDYFAVTNVLWLGDGIEGDDTDGHIDDLTRFIDRTTVVTVVEENEADSNFEPLRANLVRLRGMHAEDGTSLTVRTLPMPPRLVREGQVLPASYANYYVANGVVLLPGYDERTDALAAAVLREAFPTREVEIIDCRDLIWGLGAFHCLTQQQPAV